MLSVHNISFAYDKVDVLKNISFKASQGDIVAILGSSGSGKSTFLRVLSGLEIPKTGGIILNNETIVNDKTMVPAEARGISMVFQEYALFPHLTVKKNIMFGMHRLPKSCVKDRLKEMMNLTNLDEKLSAYPHELSGGQQQRVALARALAPKPKMLLLDEPFSNLDADLKYKIRLELKSILKTANITTIFVTHDYDDAFLIADKIIYLENGTIVREELPKRT
ncbi:MAG: ABC transporter ATP-binding protein [Candidatus Izemoplasmataceae bacterium]